MTKKLFAISLSLALLFTGCSDTDNSSDKQKSSSDINSPIESSVNAESNPNIIFATALETTAKAEEIMDLDNQVNPDGYNIVDEIGDCYVGYTSKCIVEGELYEQIPKLINSKTKKEVPIKYPQGYPTDSKSNGSYVVMNDRYIYQWVYSPIKPVTQLTSYKLLLTCLDVSTGTMTIKNTVTTYISDVKLCKYNDSSFLSYYSMPTSVDDSNPSYLSVLEVYDTKGGHKEILRESVSWDKRKPDDNSKLHTEFCVNEGLIYAYGQTYFRPTMERYIDQYDINGNLIGSIDNTDNLFNIDFLKGTMPNRMNVNGNYLTFTGEDANYRRQFIYEIKNGKLNTIAESTDSYQLFYSVANNNNKQLTPYILLTKKSIANASFDDNYIVYCFDTISGKNKSFDFTTFSEFPYFEFKFLSNGDVLFSYCEQSYNPPEVKQILLSADKLAELMK